MQLRCLQYTNVTTKYPCKWMILKSSELNWNLIWKLSDLFAIAAICILELWRCLIAVQRSNLYLGRIWFKCLASKITLYADIENSMLSQFFTAKRKPQQQQHNFFLNCYWPTEKKLEYCLNRCCLSLFKMLITYNCLQLFNYFCVFDLQRVIRDGGVTLLSK